MATPTDIINRALRSLAVLGEGETASANQLDDGLVYLNDMLESWANDSLMLFQVSNDVIPLVPGKKDYTIGEGSFDVNSVRPVEIIQAFVRLNGIDYPVSVVDRERYQSLSLKAVLNNIPSWLYYDTGFPSSTIRLWAVPSVSYDLHVDSQKPLAKFSTLSTTVSLPPGYDRALRLNLAVEMMPEYQVSNPKIERMARQAMAGIKRANRTPIRAKTLGLSGGRRYSVYSDSTR